MRDAVDVAVVVLDDQEKSRLLFLQSLPYSLISQEFHEAYQLDSRQDRRSSKLPTPLGLQEFVLAEGIQNFGHRTNGFSNRLPCQRVNRRGTRSQSQDGVPTQLHQHQQAYWHWELDGDRKSVGKSGNVARRQGKLHINMCENRVSVFTAKPAQGYP